ncbi:MAG TPA: class IV adenylate cyclase [Pyrinomonadaceae bacterium]|nr:class IV adenylate cyclase [Pyrinomonadaceae bacterium]
MPIETEKKYRLTSDQREQVRKRLSDLGAERKGEDFEENTIYTGHGLAAEKKVLRLRRVGDSATLTYKHRLPGPSAIKHQHEEETVVANPDAMRAILEAVGFKASLVYEKRRETWTFDETEIVIDELPFGLFMEIEGKERDIEAAESKLNFTKLEPELATYPQLTKQHGTPSNDVIEARFKKG